MLRVGVLLRRLHEGDARLAVNEAVRVGLLEPVIESVTDDEDVSEVTNVADVEKDPLSLLKELLVDDDCPSCEHETESDADGKEVPDCVLERREPESVADSDGEDFIWLGDSVSEFSERERVTAFVMILLMVFVRVAVTPTVVDSDGESETDTSEDGLDVKEGVALCELLALNGIPDIDNDVDIDGVKDKTRVGVVEGSRDADCVRTEEFVGERLSVAVVE